MRLSSEPRPRPGLSRARARPPVPRRSRARSTGLDIGTFAVRAAEVTMLRGRPVVTRFGQVTLPPGAVRAGEVVDPEAVIAAIHRLWAEGGFRGRRVVIGVANSRVVVRQADLPAMGEADLRSALRFEAAELIPLPVEESQLDFQVLESVDNGAGEPRVRLLLAAGQRDMIDLAVTTAGAARLSPSAVDVVPLSLVRALGSAGGEEPGRTAEAIVAVGAGVTNVVVHDGGVPCYVRILGAGADSITDALVAQLALPVDAAEDLKRRIGSPGGPALRPAGTFPRPGAGGTGAGWAAGAAAGAVVADRLAPLVAEIRGSLEFYSIQPGALPLGRVVLTGGGSQTPGLLESLSDQLAVPVTRGRLSDRIEVADQAVSPARREMAEPLMAVAVGLALAGLPDGGGRRITLLPPVAAERRRARAEALAVAGAVVAVAAVLVGAWVVRGRQVVDQRQAAAQSQAQVTVLRHQVGSYAGVTRIDAEAAAGAKRIEGVLGRDVAWTTLLSGLAGHMPADTWLTSFQGTAPTGTTPGKVSLAGSGLAQTSTAHWLQDESALPSLTELWVSSSTKGSGKGPVTFSATADLTPRAYSRRAQAYLGGTGGTGR